MWASGKGRCDIAGGWRGQHDFDGKCEGNSCAESYPDQKEEEEGSRREVCKDENTTNRPNDEKQQDPVRKSEVKVAHITLRAGGGKIVICLKEN